LNAGRHWSEKGHTELHRSADIAALHGTNCTKRDHAMTLLEGAAFPVPHTPQAADAPSHITSVTTLTTRVVRTGLTWCLDGAHASTLAAFASMSTHTRTGSKLPGAARAMEAANALGQTTRTCTPQHSTGHHKLVLGCSISNAACAALLACCPAAAVACAVSSCPAGLP
jgi:hypothetical protein